MKLAYGVSSVDIPDDCAAALGYRAILRNGCIDIVQDRVARHFPTQEGHDALLDWYGTKVMNWLDNLALMLRGNDPRDVCAGRGPISRQGQRAGVLWISVRVRVGGPGRTCGRLTQQPGVLT